MTNITKQQYEWAEERLEFLLRHVSDNTPDNDPLSIELDIVSNLIEEYEDEYYPIPEPTIGTYIRCGLQECGMTAKQLAEKVGVSASRISEYINDKSQPSLHVAKLICQTLGIDPGEFLDAA